jgi:hypothetical protein
MTGGSQCLGVDGSGCRWPSDPPLAAINPPPVLRNVVRSEGPAAQPQPPSRRSGTRRCRWRIPSCTPPLTRSVCALPMLTAWAHRSVPNESKPERSRRSGRGFLQRAVAEVYDAVAESALVEERELGARAPSVVLGKAFPNSRRRSAAHRTSSATDRINPSSVRRDDSPPCATALRTP